MYQHLENILQKRRNEGSFRTFLNHKCLIDFSSNDYLGMAQNVLLKKKTEELFQQYFTTNVNGSTGSRLLSGNHFYTEITEKQLAQFFQSESALIFNSGYTANLALFSCIPLRGDTIIYDERIHASVKDGARLSLARRFSFRHNDLDDLRKKIKTASGKVYVAIEAVYSMDGDMSPIEEIIDVCQSEQAFLIVDEAHTTGWYGDRGVGLCCFKNVHNKIFARVYTFGKAMGIHGACIAGGKTLIDYLINFARPLIYTTALSPHNIASISASVSVVADARLEREKLVKNIHIYTSLVDDMQLSKTSSQNNTPIQIIKITGNHRVKQASSMLLQAGFNVRPILSPTVPHDHERLRICLHSFNTEEQITNLLVSISKNILRL